MTHPHYVVGAYASMPASRAQQEDYYALLGAQSWIDGAELPWPGDLADADARAWLAAQLPAHWHHCSVTLIPGTMRRVGDDDSFGLASPQEGGRAAAMRMLAEARDAIAALADLRGSADVSLVQIHTAPTARADADAMRRSLDELLGWDWSGAHIAIEHCDRYIPGQLPEKGFLPIEDEIALCRTTGAGLVVNWGRSCLEGHDPALPERHVRLAAEAGVLLGLMFSGSGPEPSPYGGAWADGHLPMAPDEPTSLMTAEHICACVAAAGAPERVGAKVCVPTDATLDERLACLAHIHDAVSLTEAV